MTGWLILLYVSLLATWLACYQVGRWREREHAASARMLIELKAGKEAAQALRAAEDQALAMVQAAAEEREAVLEAANQDAQALTRVAQIATASMLKRTSGEQQTVGDAG